MTTASSQHHDERSPLLGRAPVEDAIGVKPTAAAASSSSQRHQDGALQQEVNTTANASAHAADEEASADAETTIRNKSSVAKRVILVLMISKTRRYFPLADAMSMGRLVC